MPDLEAILETWESGNISDARNAIRKFKPMQMVLLIDMMMEFNGDDHWPAVQQELSRLLGDR